MKTMKVTNSFCSATYTFLYFVPNRVKSKQKTIEDRINQRQFIDRVNLNLHSKYRYSKTSPQKIPRVKSMNFSEITL